jgi:glycyl-tRNA synthetase
MELRLRSYLREDEAGVLDRAGELAKCDLASSMVIELSSLAGTMAREYALRAGEQPAVAEALYEMELPRSAGDTLPRLLPGTLLALADRLDLLAGLFAVGAAPTGSSDPYGMRRAALGVVAILRTHPAVAAITVREGLTIAARHQPVPALGEPLDAAVEFVTRRFEQMLLDEGHPVQVVRAVLSHAGRPAQAERMAGDLAKLLEDERFQRLSAALQRVLRIVPDDTEAGYTSGLFEEAAEHHLNEVYLHVKEGLGIAPDTLPAFTETAFPLAAAIDAYFDQVMVMADDPIVRTNRLGFLATIRDAVLDVVEWREVP